MIIVRDPMEVSRTERPKFFGAALVCHAPVWNWLSHVAARSPGRLQAVTGPDGGIVTPRLSEFRLSAPPYAPRA
jgi:hypothetical protein